MSISPLFLNLDRRRLAKRQGYEPLRPGVDILYLYRDEASGSSCALLKIRARGRGAGARPPGLRARVRARRRAKRPPRQHTPRARSSSIHRAPPIASGARRAVWCSSCGRSRSRSRRQRAEPTAARLDFAYRRRDGVWWTFNIPARHSGGPRLDCASHVRRAQPPASHRGQPRHAGARHRARGGGRGPHRSEPAHASRARIEPRAQRRSEARALRTSRERAPSRVSVFAPGETIEVIWAETTNHRSYYRIAFDRDGDDAFPTFAGPGIGAEGSIHAASARWTSR